MRNIRLGDGMAEAVGGLNIIDKETMFLEISKEFETRG